MLLPEPYFLKNKEWYTEEDGLPEFLGGNVKRRYKLTDKATPKAIKSYNEYYEMVDAGGLVINDIENEGDN